jgi:hypothetical protein
MTCYLSAYDRGILQFIRTEQLGRFIESIRAKHDERKKLSTTLAKLIKSGVVIKANEFYFVNECMITGTYSIKIV